MNNGIYQSFAKGNYRYFCFKLTVNSCYFFIRYKIGNGLYCVIEYF